MPTDVPFKHKRNCPCEHHTRLREAARASRERKKQGGPPLRNSEEPVSLSLSAVANRQARPRVAGSRLVEDRSGPDIVVHWMPKDEMEWECPECGKWFLKVDGEWKEPWVA